MIGPRELFTSHQSLELLRDLLDVPGSRSPRAKLELVLLDLLFQYDSYTPQTSVPEPILAPIQEDALEEIEEVPNQEELSKTEVDTIVRVIDPAPSEELWQQALAQLKTKHNTLYSIARMAHADLVDNSLNIVFKFPFHFKKVNDDKNRRILAQVIKDLGHDDLLIQITLAAEETHTDLPPPPVNQSGKEQDLTTINNIFGDSEVLES
jgi:hypothetical protein